VWAAWHLIAILTQSFSKRAEETPSAVDDITVSLSVSAVRLAIAFAAVTYVATELSIPTNGILAGLAASPSRLHPRKRSRTCLARESSWRTALSKRATLLPQEIFMARSSKLASAPPGFGRARTPKS
jgi:hypothetical protein